MDLKSHERTLLPDAIREVLAADPDLGAGNFIHKVVAASPAADAPIFWMNKPAVVLGGESVSALSLRQLKALGDRYAAWYHANGIREKDPVAVYLDEGILNLVHYLAITSLGAIPVLINGNMRPEIAAGFIAKVGAVALFSDDSHYDAVSAHLGGVALRFAVTNETAASLAEGKLPPHYPYRHDARDPVFIGHSSGTTGIPKAVEFTHYGFFYGIRYRLSLPRSPGAERLLSALPHSHSAGVAYLMLAALQGASMMVLTDNAPEVVLPAIEAFRPSMVAAFPETYVELSESEYAKFDLSSIRLWVNGGDAAHETHIRRLTSVGTWVKDGVARRGSIFIDGLGSSEMGFSLFRNVHTPESDHFARCIGTPLEWVDAAVLGDDGEILPPFRVGRLGVRAPSVTPGYWNDSVLTARTRVHGYWLTGDLFYRDDKGRFFHVDRIPDAIHATDGTVYSLETEELLMRFVPELADVTVVGVPARDGTVPVAFARLREGARLSLDSLKGRMNAVLAAQGKKVPLADVLATDPSVLPLGPTGKVLKRELREMFKNHFSTARRAVAQGGANGFS